MMDLVLLGADKDALKESKGKRNVAVAKISAEQIEGETQGIHAKKRIDRKLAREKENEKSRRHAQAQAVAKRGNGGF